MSWCAKGTAGHETHGQSAVYDEETGTDIAIVYDGAKHGRLIAAAPDLFALLEAAADMQDTDGYIGCKLMEEIRAALAKAEGRET